MTNYKNCKVVNNSLRSLQFQEVLRSLLRYDRHFHMSEDGTQIYHCKPLSTVRTCYSVDAGCSVSKHTARILAIRYYLGKYNDCVQVIVTD